MIVPVVVPGVLHPIVPGVVDVAAAVSTFGQYLFTTGGRPGSWVLEGVPVSADAHEAFRVIKALSEREQQPMREGISLEINGPLAEGLGGPVADAVAGALLWWRLQRRPVEIMTLSETLNTLGYPLCAVYVALSGGLCVASDVVSPPLVVELPVPMDARVERGASRAAKALPLSSGVIVAALSSPDAGSWVALEAEGLHPNHEGWSLRRGQEQGLRLSSRGAVAYSGLGGAS